MGGLRGGGGGPLDLDEYDDGARMQELTFKRIKQKENKRVKS